VGDESKNKEEISEEECLPEDVNLGLQDDHDRQPGCVKAAKT